MSKINLSLTESELKIVLEALTDMETKMAHVCATSDNEDEISDIGNDLIELRLLVKPLVKRATREFGENINNFSRESL